jgi:Bacterial protein of unknown function (DUF839)
VSKTRREFIGAGVGGVAAVAIGAALWDDVLGSAETGARKAVTDYGPLGPPNADGIRLPPGFRSRTIARGDEAVEGTDYLWHVASDGAATFATDDGGWILISNSETQPDGGASAIRFGPTGDIATAYRVLDGTRMNCSGGGTPWGTWLSCEEVDDGLVWECDPGGSSDALVRPAMGVFKHEAAAVDTTRGCVYLTEDIADGRFYRFTPTRWPDLGAGLLEVATVDRSRAVSWTPVPDPSARTGPTRLQVPDSTPFRRAEGLWHDGPVVYLGTTVDSRVLAYDTREERIEVVYDGEKSPTAPLTGVDQMAANSAGEIFVCEDNGDAELDVGVIDRGGDVARFLSVSGSEHVGSELTGVAFDPSGTRMYFASQRAGGTVEKDGPGAIYEVEGPFHTLD